MRDGAAEGGAPSPLGIDMDPVVVAGRLREAVDLVLRDGVPCRGSELARRRAESSSLQWILRGSATR